MCARWPTWWNSWQVPDHDEEDPATARKRLLVVTPVTTPRTRSWPGPLRRQIEDYHILDFSNWHDEAEPQAAVPGTDGGVAAVLPERGAESSPVTNRQRSR